MARTQDAPMTWLQLRFTWSLLLEPGGCLALSGILTEQSPAVAASFTPWCALQPVAIRDDRVLLAGTRYANGA